MHPDYLSTKHAAQFSVPIRHVQHHWAHIVSCMAENELSAPLLGVSWDGTGYGGDGTIWGGEFRGLTQTDFNRVGHLRQFRLPGGEAAVKEPRRSAVGLLYEIFGDQLWSHNHLLTGSISPATSCPLSSNARERCECAGHFQCGALVRCSGGSDRSAVTRRFEGQAAMELEFAAYERVDDKYSFALQRKSPFVIDWQPAILEIIDDLRAGETRGMISAKFHNMLCEMIVAVARKIGQDKVVLSGGCFQNRLLTERTIDRLAAGKSSVPIGINESRQMMAGYHSGKLSQPLSKTREASRKVFR